MIALLGVAALAAEPHVVREGETIESIAGAEAAAVRATNGLAAGEQPAVGSVVLLPGVDLHEIGAVVLSVSGTGRVLAPSAPAAPLERDRALPVGTTVCTDAGSYATVRLAVTAGSGEHDEVTLLGGTCLTLRASLAAPNRRVALVDLDSGSIAARQSATPGELAIRTDSGVTRAERGGFRVTVEDGAMRTEALWQPVAVFGAGRELALEPGFGSRVHKGAAPGAPVPLLPPGTPTTPADGAPLRRPEFAWVPVERALGYRVEIATDDAFTELVRVEDLDAPSWAADDLFLPYRVRGLWWRISSFDRTGFLGVPSEGTEVVIPAGIGP